MDHYASTETALKLAYDLMAAGEEGRAEAVLFAYLNQDDGTLDFLQAVKIPLLHVLGRLYFRQARWQDARRRLRDAFALSQAFPGTTPSYGDSPEEAIVAFVRDACGMALPDA